MPPSEPGATDARKHRDCGQPGVSPGSARGQPEGNREQPGSAGNVGQEILQRTNTKITLLQGPNGLRGSATA